MPRRKSVTGLGPTIRQVRSAAWRVQRAAGDLSAADQGPGAYVRRRARAAGYRPTYRGVRRVLRGLGLGG